MKEGIDCAGGALGVAVGSVTARLPRAPPATAAAGRRGKSCCKDRAGEARAALASQGPPGAVRKPPRAFQFSVTFL